MVVARMLDAPVPIAVAVVQGTAPDGLVGGGPGWLMGALFGVWLVLWLLDRIGKLPGRVPNGVHAGYQPPDRERLNRVHDLLAWKDDDGVPRFLRHVMETHQAVERQHIHVENQQKLNGMIDDNNKLVGLVTDQLRAMNQRLDALERNAGGAA